jgi:starvation-inducible DNA-binding protein
MPGGRDSVDDMATKKRSARRIGRRTNSVPTASARPDRADYTVAGLKLADGHKLAALLQERLNSLVDLALTLKHVHWNVVGPHFIAVHEMIDPHVVEVQAMVDETAERIATLGVSPKGTPGALVAGRTWDDYSLGRATTNEHLGALDVVYDGLLEDHRAAVDAAGKIDSMTEDMLIGQTRQLELFHWFIRAHLETVGGELATGDASKESTGARRAARAARHAG